LRLNEKYDPSVEDERPLLEEKVIGVPGVSPNASPISKLRSSAPSPSPSPLRGKVNIPSTPKTPLPPNAPPPTPVNRRNEFDVSTELSGFGLQGVKVRSSWLLFEPRKWTNDAQVTDDDLLKLVEELGLGEDEAGDLVKGLGASEPIQEEAEPEGPADNLEMMETGSQSESTEKVQTDKAV
jgi:SH3 domain-binding glutamic acid-rich protein